MFKKAKPAVSLLDIEIERTLKFLRGEQLSTDEYNDALENLIKLENVRDKQKSSQISKDTIAIVGANLVGILLVIRHEHVNVITSKAMNMVQKPR